jgi:hypothetical protein
MGGHVATINVSNDLRRMEFNQRISHWEMKYARFP